MKLKFLWVLPWFAPITPSSMFLYGVKKKKTSYWGYSIGCKFTDNASSVQVRQETSELRGSMESP